MKTIWKELAVCTLLGIVLPGAMMQITSRIRAQNVEKVQAVAETAPETMEPLTGNPRIPVLMEDGSVKDMDMEEYLVGVVLAEMPADFEGEALKAQAVAARTYAAKAHLQGGKHGDGSVCTDYRCCQAYIPESEYLSSGGSQLGIRKVRTAVEETEGQVLTYNGELIEATYFSCSGGTTEDAQAVWGAEFPYLKSVESPGEEDSQFYETTVTFPKERVETLLGLELSENPMEWIGEVKKTPGNGVATIEIGGRIFKGTELRTLLGLRSTAFTAFADDRGLTVDTRGYGHRVGMSQYGADAMAVLGKQYDEILSHYYRGTELSHYQPPEGEFTEVSQETGLQTD